jgi:hypothetical protein
MSIFETSRAGASVAGNVKPIASKVTEAQYELIEQLADKAGMTLGQYIRDVIFKQHVEGLDIQWPGGFTDVGEITEWGGKRKGAGRKPKVHK